MRNLKFQIVLILVVLFSTNILHAQLAEKISIHGFGGWAAGSTDNSNMYLLSSKDVEYSNYNFSLNIAAQPTEKFSIHSQLFWSREKYKQKDGLDYMFAQYYYSLLLTFRIGKVKSPMGLYSEIYDVGTLRPFYLLPVGMYNGPGMFPKSYIGLGITGGFTLSDTWEINYDFISGEMEFPEFRVDMPVFDPVTGMPSFDPATMIPETKSVDSKPIGREVIGVKVSVNSPLLGLNLGLAYMSLDPSISLNDGIQKRIEATISNRLNIVVGHFEYQTDKFSFRSEMYKLSKDIEIMGGYFETSYRFFNNWQLALDYDWFASKKKGIFEKLDVSSSFDHKSIGMGLNYWFNPNLVLKGSVYMIKGNAFAQPEQLLETYFAGNLKEKTNAIIIGTQFSF